MELYLTALAWGGLFIQKPRAGSLGTYSQAVCPERKGGIEL